MTTSLPPTDALFHMTAKVFQRSQRRSAVAAAAYRSASKLSDDRTGQDFDYTRKHVVDTFIMAPSGAPEWTQDRQELWNRVEAAEKRKDAQIARKVEISIPRDIPPEEWPTFARAVAAYYVAAGSIADVAIHCPRDVYGEAQPHLHIMLSPRALDRSTETGFAQVRNPALNSIFTSGSRHGGGKHGDALKAERARVADVMNTFLEAAGSERRASHLSNSARGLEDREPEPTVGEGRKHASRKRQKGDRTTALVGSMRKARTLENELNATEEAIMATNSKFQLPGAAGLKPKNQQDYKKRLLSEHFPDALKDIDADKLHMINVKNPAVTKIQTRDGGWIEVDHGGRTIKTYGKPGYADEVAKAIYNADYADDLERLEEMQSTQRKNSGIRGRRKATDPAPSLPMSEVETRADKWRSRGFTDITEASDGTWIRVGACRLQDLGDEVRVHGKPDAATARAMLTKAVDEWGSEIEVFGSKDFKNLMWLEGQRQGVAIYDKDTGDLYEPSTDIKKAFEADRQKIAENTVDLDAVRNERAVAGLLREAAAGDVAALAKLESNDPHLVDFLSLRLDDEQRAELAADSEAELVPQLEGFREFGKEEREEDDKRRASGRRPPSTIPEVGTVQQDNEHPADRAAITRSLAMLANDYEQDFADEMDLVAEAIKAEQAEREKYNRRPE